jgi:branched-chain amino acid transport system substrate-binding protein
MIRRSCAPLRRLAILAALALACVPSAGFPAVDPVVVPAILPLTGNGAFYGHQMEIAVKAVEAYVNKNGGINGRPVSFLIEDDQSNAQIGVQLAQELRAKHVPLILGPGWGQSCSALLPLNAKDGPVTYCLSNAIRPAAGSYVFSAYQATNDMLMASLRYFRERSWTRLAYLVAIDASGQDAERAIENALAAPENAGFKVVAREHFAASDGGRSGRDGPTCGVQRRTQPADVDLGSKSQRGDPKGTMVRFPADQFALPGFDGGLDGRGKHAGVEVRRQDLRRRHRGV